MKKIITLLSVTVFVLGCTPANDSVADELPIATNQEEMDLSTLSEEEKNSSELAYTAYEPISGCYTMYKDSLNVYFNDEVIEEADAASFEALERDEQLYKDKNAVYSIFHGHSCATSIRRYEGADPETFELLDFYGEYAKDKNHVYFEFEILEGVSPDNFTVPE